MPGLRFQCAGADFFGIEPGIPEHAFLYDDGDDRCNQCKNAGRDRRLIGAVENGQQGLFPDRQAGDEQDPRQDQGGHILHPLMAVGMVRIRGLFRHPDADNDNQAPDHIRGRVHGVADHRSGMPHHSRDEFKPCQQQVYDNAHS